MTAARAAESTPTPAPAWHALDTQEVVERLQVDPSSGLAAHAAGERLARHGPNKLPAARPRPAWLRLLLQFHNVLIYLMLAGAVVTALLGHWIDTGVLMTAVIVNAVIGFVQEGKAESALDAIRQMLSPQATVTRDGRRGQLPAESLVPGDIVTLVSGDKVPADLRLLSARGVHAEEAALTGESLPVDKAVEPVPPYSALGDRRSMLYSGTLIASGVAVGVVVATGSATELGRISTMLARVQQTTTPLLRQIDGFSRWLAFVIVLIGVAAFVLGVFWRAEPPDQMFMMVVALVASAIPEGLPAIMTITLALGVRRMAGRNAIVRQLPAVETLGSVTVICSDKTGTLTRNEMAVQRVVSADHVFEASGAQGYGPEGTLARDGLPVSAADDAALVQICRAGVLCNDAELRAGDGGWRLDGDPTEGALLALALRAGLDLDGERQRHPRIDVIPFESDLRFMATLHRLPGGGHLICVKGAPERVLEMCGREGILGQERALDPDYWRRAANDLAARAMRVLAVAARQVPPSHTRLAPGDVDEGFTLLGLFGSIDPPRAEAMAAVAECRAAGIRVKMITGDHLETARAIGAQLGIGQGRPGLTGAEIELMDDEALRKVVPEVDVFARASPEHKLRLVEALQAARQVVAMTGDGVNDAPALRRADIGVAMGRKGTEAAKEAADVVLADDNFATIGNAVREGRGVYDNIRKFILFMLPTNGGEMLVVLAAMLFGFVLPLTPAQVLWINMATSSTLGLALAFEPAEADVMARRPRDPNEPLLSGFFAWRIVMVSVLMMTGTLAVFLYERSLGSPLETARTVAVCAVVVAEMFYLLNSRFVHRSVLSVQGLFGNRYALAAIGACVLLQITYTHWGPLQRIFASTDLSAAQWGRALLAGLLVFLVAELEKSLVRRLPSRPRAGAVSTAEPART